MARPTSTSATTSASSTSRSTATPTPPPGRSTPRCWARSAGATTWARPSRSSPTSPTRSRSRIRRLATDDVDIVITEIGGTVGDIEILPFLEAIRQFRKDVGRENVFYIHVTLVPFIGPSGEQKTKPTQHSVTELRGRGIQPDAIVCRSDRPISTRLKEKISQLCDVPEEGIVSAIDAANLYEIPLVLHDEGLDAYIGRVLGLPVEQADLGPWRNLVHRVETSTTEVRIGLVGKYVNLPTPTCRWSRR